MAQPVATYATNDMIGIREDLEDMIYNISPEDTPLLSMLPKTKARATLHEWQTDALRASAVNAHIEGDDTTASARSPTTRLTNRTQIFKNAIVVTDTESFVNKAGRGEEMAYQTVKEMAAQNLDVELALFANQAKVTGSDVLAPKMAGLGSWIATNTVNETGNGGADPTGDGSNARTDDGTPVAFSQTRFDTAVRTQWTNGGKPQTVFLNAFQMNVALGFTGGNNQRNTVKSNEVDKLLDVYSTPWGMVKFTICREIRARDVWIMQNDMAALAVLRPAKTVPLAKTGDSEKRQLTREVTLVMRNQGAHSAVLDNTTS